MPWSCLRCGSLLHDRGHLAAPLSLPALLHSSSGIRPRLENSRTNREAVDIHHLCLNKIEISELEAKGSQCSKSQPVRHPNPFCTSLCDDNHRPVTLEFHMLLLIVDMCIFIVTGLFTSLNNVPGLHMHTFTMCALLFAFTL